VKSDEEYGQAGEVLGVTNRPLAEAHEKKISSALSPALLYSFRLG
jgi:hypothetical protein